MNQQEFCFFMDHCDASEEYTQTGCTILYDSSQAQFVLMKEITLGEDEDADTMVDILLKQKELYHDHLLSLIDFYPSMEEPRIVKFYEYCSHTLLQEIESRMDTGKHFTEEQLENILVSVLKLLEYLETVEIGHGCISPLDICLSDGMVKVVDPSIASSSPFMISDGYYYSPELLEQTLRQEGDSMEIFRNDVFSLAMCIIHCGLLESCHDCYDYESGELVFEVLEERLSQFSQMYSQRLLGILIRMLDEEVTTRPTPTEALELIEEQFEQEKDLRSSEQELKESEGEQLSEQSEYVIEDSADERGLPPVSKSLFRQKMSVKPLGESKHPSNQNASSMANISQTQERLAAMINRAKVNIHKLKEKNAS